MKKYNLNNFYLLLSNQLKNQIFVYIIISFLFLLFNIFSFSLLVPFFSSLIDFSLIDKLKFFSIIKETSFLKNKTNQDVLISLGVVAFFLILLSNYLLYYNEKLKFGLISSIAKNISKNFISSILEIKFEKFISFNKSVVISKLLIELESVVIQIFYNVFEFISRIFIVLIIFIALLTIEPIITFVAFFSIIIIFTIVFNFFKKRFNQLGKDMVNSNTARTLHLTEIIKNFISIRLNNLNSYFQSKFLGSTNKYYLSLSKSEITKKIPKTLIEASFFGIVILLSILLLQNDFSNMKNLTISLSAFALASYKIMPSIQQIFFSVSTFKNAFPKFQSLINELKKMRKEKKKIIIEDLDKFLDKENTITAKNVSLKAGDKIIIKKLNFQIKKNTINCISGKSGSGKTLLLHAIIGLIKPYAGSIKIYNKDSYMLSDEIIENLLSFTPQITDLFYFNVKKNIHLEKKLDKKNLLKSLNFSKFHKTNLLNLNNLKRNLSGGEIKRILLSRNIYQNRNLVILDEPTVYLDNKNVNQIIKNIKKLKNKTIIFSTHNHKLKKIAHNIIEL